MKSNFKPINSDADGSGINFDLPDIKSFISEGKTDSQLNILKYLENLISGQWIDLEQLITVIEDNLEHKSADIIELIKKYSQENEFLVFDEKINLNTDSLDQETYAEELLNTIESFVSSSSDFSGWLLKKVRNITLLNKELEERLGYLMERSVKDLTMGLIELNKDEWNRLNAYKLNQEEIPQIEDKEIEEVEIEGIVESVSDVISVVEDEVIHHSEFAANRNFSKLENQHFKYYWRHVIKLRNNRALIENNESGRQNPSLQCTSNLLAVLKEGLSEKKYDLLENNILNYERHRNRFVESNLKLVLFMSKKYWFTGVPLQDLFNEGCMGLMKAVEKYNRYFGYKFSTYAYHWIKQSITRCIDNHQSLIWIPRTIREEKRKLEKEIYRLEAKILKKYELSDIYKYSKFSYDRVNDLLLSSHTYVYLDHMNETEKDEIFYGLSENNFNHQIKSIENLELNENIHEGLSTLNEREEEILTLRYGLKNNPEHSLQQIAYKYGVTRERIRQIEKYAITKMRHPSRAWRYADYTNINRPPPISAIKNHLSLNENKKLHK
jgi:RNA polymerase primary sigma factor